MAVASRPGIWRPWEGPRSLTCICSATFRTTLELRRHCKSCHYPKTKICCICQESFTRKDNLTRHMKSKHDSKCRPTCKFCTKLLSRQDSAARHERTCRENPGRRHRGSANLSVQQGSPSPGHERNGRVDDRGISRPNVIMSLASVINAANDRSRSSSSGSEEDLNH